MHRIFSGYGGLAVLDIRNSARDHRPSQPLVQVVTLAREMGMVGLGRLGIDGTKVRANASRRKAMSYGRMRERERQLKAEINELLKQARRQDREED